MVVAPMGLPLCLAWRVLTALSGYPQSGALFLSQPAWKSTMVRAIIKWSLHNRLIVMLGLWPDRVGIYSANNLNVEAYPDPTPPLVEVITQNPGPAPRRWSG